MFYCNLCNTDPFTRKFNLNRHINTVHKGGSKTNKKKCQIHYCRHCNIDKKFARKDERDAHEKRCKKIKQRFVTKEISKNKENENVNTNGNENVNVNTNGNENTIDVKVNKNSNNNINIILLNYPPDKYSFISNLGEILNSDDNLIMEIIKKTNTNKNRPEHHNVYYPDIKNSTGFPLNKIYILFNGEAVRKKTKQCLFFFSTGEIYKNNKWNLKTIDEIVNIMIDNNTDCLKTYLKDLGIVLDEKTIKKIKNTCQEFYNADARKKLSKHIKILLYDNRDIIKDIWDSIMHFFCNAKKSISTPNGL
jgi:hypothetical protein